MHPGSKNRGIGALLTSVLFMALPLPAQETEGTPSEGAGAEQPSLEQIVHRTNWRAYYQGDDGRARVRMAIQDAQGRERNREFTILRKDMTPDDMADEDFVGRQRFYVYFHRPADVSGMAYLVWKNPDGTDDRWLYLPALDLMRRIAASDKRTSFAGSHFFYEDVSGRSITDDHHELQETTDVYFVLKNTPKDPGLVEFEYYKMWIHKETFLPIRIEYYDRNDRKYREYQAEEVRDIDGYMTVVRSSMRDLDSGGKTVLEYSNVDYNLDIREDIFSERFLRRPPRRYLR